MSRENLRVAILASGDRESGGGGSTLERVARDVQDGLVSFSIDVVVCNNPEGTVGVYPKIDRVNQDYDLQGDDKINVVNIGPNTHPGHPIKRGQTLDESAAISQLLKERDIDFVWMLGYMRILTGELVKDWCWHPGYSVRHGFEHRSGIYHPSARIGNNHPAILPFTKDTHGPSAHQKAIELHNERGLTHTAMTWHLASRSIDDGPIVAEEPIEIRSNDNADTLAERVQAIEKEMTSRVIDKHLKLRAQALAIHTTGRALGKTF